MLVHKKRAALSNKACKCEGRRALDPVHSYPEIFVSSIFFMRIQILSAFTPSLCKSYTTVHTYPIRIRTYQKSQRRSQQSSRGKSLVLILWRQRIQKYTDTSVHTYPDTRRVQKFPLWRAYTPSVYGGHVWTQGLSEKKFADTKISADTCGRGLISSCFLLKKWGRGVPNTKIEGSV